MTNCQYLPSSIGSEINYRVKIGKYLLQLQWQKEATWVRMDTQFEFE